MTHFAHSNLHCYKAALDLAILCDSMLQSCGSEHAKLRDNLRRSTEGIPLLIAEGANRRTTAMFSALIRP